MVVLLQLPEGLKHKAPDIIKKYNLENVVLSASAMYGGCDIAIDEAKAIGANKIIHVGHNYFPLKRNIDGITVEYIPYYIDIEIGWPELVEELKANNIKTISILTTAQYLHLYDKIVEYFNNMGFINEVKKGPFCSNIGQVLGCDGYGVSSKAEAIIVIADGYFHWTAIPYEISKNIPVYGLDPFTKKHIKVNKAIQELNRKRIASIFKAAEAKRYGILVSTKPGQFSLKLALKMEKELKELNREAYILVANNLDPATISNFIFLEAFINTACPRIVDDINQYNKPILNPDGYKLMLKIIKGEVENIDIFY